MRAVPPGPCPRARGTLGSGIAAVGWGSGRAGAPAVEGQRPGGDGGRGGGGRGGQWPGGGGGGRRERPLGAAVGSGGCSKEVAGA
ncbi:hypothetical protein EF915_05125 [Streptomyces sp. WAC08401]|nr:hypothetical protein EF915_05125 [Streptomyces sp. WAC08401]